MPPIGLDYKDTPAGLLGLQDIENQRANAIASAQKQALFEEEMKNKLLQGLYARELAPIQFAANRTESVKKFMPYNPAQVSEISGGGYGKEAIESLIQAEIERRQKEVPAIATPELPGSKLTMPEPMTPGQAGKAGVSLKTGREPQALDLAKEAQNIGVDLSAGGFKSIKERELYLQQLPQDAQMVMDLATKSQETRNQVYSPGFLAKQSDAVLSELFSKARTAEELSDVQAEQSGRKFQNSGRGPQGALEDIKARYSGPLDVGALEAIRSRNKGMTDEQGRAAIDAIKSRQLMQPNIPLTLPMAQPRLPSETPALGQLGPRMGDTESLMRYANSLDPREAYLSDDTKDIADKMLSVQAQQAAIAAKGYGAAATAEQKIQEALARAQAQQEAAFAKFQLTQDINDLKTAFGDKWKMIELAMRAQRPVGSGGRTAKDPVMEERKLLDANLDVFRKAQPWKKGRKEFEEKVLGQYNSALPENKAWIYSQFPSYFKRFAPDIKPAGAKSEGIFDKVKLVVTLRNNLQKKAFTKQQLSQALDRLKSQGIVDSDIEALRSEFGPKAK